METYEISNLTKKLLATQLNLFTLPTLKNLLKIENERTLFRVVEIFQKNGILTKIERNKYQITDSTVTSFELANFLYTPSYISLDSALNDWGILSQFPFEITSVTTKKTASKMVDGVLYSYRHISPKYFGMFEKKDKALIASPEKALFDQIYLATKGLKVLNMDEYDFTHINKKTFWNLCTQLHADKNILKLAQPIGK
jgi:predicted transcriptional regulator of viral defense system